MSDIRIQQAGLSLQHTTGILLGHLLPYCFCLLQFLASFCYMIAGYPLCVAKWTACVFRTIIGRRVTGDA